MNTLLDFYAEWCGPCKAMDGIINEIKGIINIQKINVDENKDLINKFNVTSLPTLILINENGELLGRLIGLNSKEKIMEMINE